MGAAGGRTICRRWDKMPHVNGPRTRLYPNFRRVVAFLRPHRRPFIAGLVLALGVGTFYTFSISAVVPLLKVLFSEHETLPVWANRVEAERRLGIVTPADVPNHPDGIYVEDVRTGRDSGVQLSPGDWIIGVADRRGSSYALLDRIANHREATLSGVLVRHVVRDAGQGEHPQEVALRDLQLAPYRGWWPLVTTAFNVLPHENNPASRTRTLTIVMLALVVVSILGGVCRFLNEGLIAVAVQRAMHDLRTGLSAHVLRLPMDWYSRHPPGDALGRFATDISKVEVGLTTLFGKTIREPLKAVGVLILTVAIDWRLLVAAAVGIPVGGLVLHAFGRGIKIAQKRASESWGRLIDHLGERLAGIRIVKAFNMETAETRAFEAEDRRLTRAQTHTEFIDAATNPALESLATVAIAIFVLYGGWLVFHKQIEANLFIAAVVCLAAMFDPIRKMGNVNNRLQAAEASAARLFELLDLQLEGQANGNVGHGKAVACEARNGGGRAAGQVARSGTEEPDSLPPFRDTIRFENVSFAYPANPYAVVLRDINLTVSKGQMIALVGPNGSGKTTLVSLLMRFFEPTAGRITIDGIDIVAVSLDSLRSQVGLVTQDTVIFSDTVRFNIAYGANGVSDEDILRASRMAHADEFIRELRQSGNGQVRSGYEAPINSRMLSGGQRQRIAIARAILRDPPILVLDEATSQVDAESERKIQEALDEVTVGRTTFVIAHRFSTIARADRIVVLDQGRVVGQGGHEDLMESCPCYANLYRTQFTAALTAVPPAADSGAE